MPRRSPFRALLATLNARLMFTCHDMTGLNSKGQDATLPRATRWRMKLHFVLCVWCRRYRRQLRFLRNALLVLPERNLDLIDHKLSPEAKARLNEILKAMEQDKSSGPQQP